MNKKLSAKDLIALYTILLEIRLFEEKVVELYPRQEMKTPVHLCTGQEAIAAAVGMHLKNDDYVFTTHRCHGHCIAKGMDIKAMMAELYGKETGCCRGKGGSMHLADAACGIPVTSAIVGGGIALAVGAALGIKFKKGKNIAVTFFGDGAVDQGIFFESLNFAALKKLPVLFVCENNFYATNSPQKARQPLDNIFKRGKIFGIPGGRCDGNDVLEVSAVAKRMIANIRRGKGPFLLECRTYRWKGHVGPNCDVDEGCRPRGEVSAWVKKCPVKRLEKSLLKNKIITREGIERIRSTLQKEITAAAEFALNSRFPDKEDVDKDVFYSKG